MTYSDPFVPRIEMDGTQIDAGDPDALVPMADCVVIVTDHTAFAYAGIVENAKLIVDTRNALKGVQSNKIVRL